MKKLFGSSGHRIALQLGLLAGVGLAFVIGGREQPAIAGGDDCPTEDECSFKKPALMILMDYSTSMNEVWDQDTQATRWEVTVDVIKQVTAPNTFLSDNMRLALIRFGHDPNPGAAQTMIPNELSGIVDGQALDVEWDDSNEAWYECNGQAIADALDAAGAPMNGSLFGIGTWTKGALDRSAAEIAQTVADHPEDDGERVYLNVLVTDGAWTGVDGTTTLTPASQNPAITASDLFDNEGVRTYVVAVAGDPQAEAAADETAMAGGTTEALDGDTPELLAEAVGDVVQSIIDEFVIPECVGGLPRVMVLLDGSSSMLNVMGGTEFGAMGQTGWDQARDALAGEMSLFDVEVDGGQALEDVVHLGLTVFGHNAPGDGEQKLVVQYGPCMRDNFEWALDPVTSCSEPGCTDPWGGPPIQWTFQDGSVVDPEFDQQTISHMPQCAGNNAFCSGSGTYTHLGLELIKDNQIQYHADSQQPDALYPTNDGTQYVNILITDGQYLGYSTDAQVQAELEAMYASGITTYVIGFGDGVNTPQAEAQLQSMAGWGSGGVEDFIDADNQLELSAALAGIVNGIDFDPCCAFNDCSVTPEPTTNEPDPVPPPPDTGEEAETEESGMEETATEDTGMEETATEEDTGMEETATEEDTATDDPGMTESESESESESDSGETGIPVDDGQPGGPDCNCSTDGPRRGGPLAVALFAVGGLLLRRRRRD